MARIHEYINFRSTFRALILLGRKENGREGYLAECEALTLGVGAGKAPCSVQGEENRGTKEN